MNIVSEPRYAIYFVPGADTPLYRFGASVLGYDCYTGLSAPLIGGAEAKTWPGVVRDPCVYGFHATLKPPFHLAEGESESSLEDAFLNFASSQPAVLVGQLDVFEINSFIALVPRTPRPLLNGLAQACVQEFDRFRRAMSEQEYARRLVPGLSDRQIGNLCRWGYPYVFDDFRFHMTLTGALSLAKRTKALQFLCAKFEQVPNVASVTVDQIAMVRQADRTSRFQVIRAAPLGQSPYRPYAYSC